MFMAYFSVMCYRDAVLYFVCWQCEPSYDELHRVAFSLLAVCYYGGCQYMLLLQNGFL